MQNFLIRFGDIVSIVGDIVTIKLPDSFDTEQPIRYRDLAIIEQNNQAVSLAQIIRMQRNTISLQVFSGSQGISNSCTVRFLGMPMQALYSNNILGRLFNGSGQTIDGGPDLGLEPKVDINSPTVNPINRVLASKMIRTEIPMIDVFNCLVESQKIPIFSVSGEPYNKLLARIGSQADADIVVFGGFGLSFDDFHFFQQHFLDTGVMSRTVMFVNQASDPVVERLMVADLALAVAERFAIDDGKRVLVLLTDMTAFADAMKEIGISMESIPSNRGYMGDLYSQLARRYEKACNYKGAGSVTILSVTTMPGDDITHPVPDNTGYITEGQFYLHNGEIDPFGSLSRLKQHVIEKETREDHGQIMNTMIRYYSEGLDAERKQAMAFDLNEFDQKLLIYTRLFRKQFMNLDVIMSLENSLDNCWKLLAQCFSKDEIVIKQQLKNKYWPA